MHYKRMKQWFCAVALTICVTVSSASPALAAGPSTDGNVVATESMAEVPTGAQATESSIASVIDEVASGTESSIASGTESSVSSEFESNTESGTESEDPEPQGPGGTDPVTESGTESTQPADESQESTVPTETEQQPDKNKGDSTESVKSEQTKPSGQSKPQSGSDKKAQAVKDQKKQAEAAQTPAAAQPAAQPAAQQAAKPAKGDASVVQEDSESSDREEDRDAEDEHDTTPEWHPEWKSRTDEFTLHRIVLTTDFKFCKVLKDGLEVMDTGEKQADDKKDTEAEKKTEETEDKDKKEEAVTEDSKENEGNTDENTESAESQTDNDDTPEEDRDPVVVGKLKKGTVVRVLDNPGGKWLFIECMDADGEFLRGYADSKWLLTVKEDAKDEKANKAGVEILEDMNKAFYDCDKTSYKDLAGKVCVSKKRMEVVNYAVQFLGNPYVWGGESLTNGCDCSGFTGGIYRHFGQSLPRCSFEQCDTGKKISIYDAQPGDLIFYSNSGGVYHVMMCYSNDGNGRVCVIHASGRKVGIIVSELSYDRACWATTYDFLDEEEDGVAKVSSATKETAKKGPSNEDIRAVAKQFAKIALQRRQALTKKSA